MKKLYALIAVLGVNLMLAGTASAGPLIFVGTVQDWIDAGTISVGDKDFVYTSSSGVVDGTDGLAIQQIGTQWTVVVGFGVGGASGPDSGTLAYDVNIVGTPFTFVAAGVDSTHVGNGTSTVEKSSPDFTTITSTKGSTDSTLITPGLTSISVLDTITIAGADANLVNISNTFTQTPEPSSIAMLAGLAGVGLIVRLRRKK